MGVTGTEKSLAGGMEREFIFCGGWVLREERGVREGGERRIWRKRWFGVGGVTDLSRCDSSESFHGGKKGFFGLVVMLN